ncbi:G-protein alpha subunit-domain-containing protein [Obelidium mucronatum]|nr:G-protein alpha subunit-domain-containing protein [Obelidium mucronatum]
MDTLKIPYGFNPLSPPQQPPPPLQLAGSDVSNGESQVQQQSTAAAAIDLSSAAAAAVVVVGQSQEESSQGHPSVDSSRVASSIATSSFLGVSRNGGGGGSGGGGGGVSRQESGLQLGNDNNNNNNNSIDREGLVPRPQDPISNLAERLYDVNHACPMEASIIKDAVIYKADRLNEAEIRAVKTLWRDTGIQYCFRRSNEFQLLDCCSYFLNDLDRLVDKKYLPTQQDILQARITTTGVTENQFFVNKEQSYKIFDVGGQRSERRKWAAHFQGVNAIIFMIAISAFDQLCSEDNETNRMVESLNLFASICNHPMFKSTSMLVFMNKIDLFKEKLKSGIKVATYFPAFSGPNNYEATSEYFAHRVTESNKYPDHKTVYIYYTWATDTMQIRTVFHTVNVILLQSQLASVGMI